MSGFKFTPGSLYITPGALEAFKASGEDVTVYLIRHIAGDWGDVDEPDPCENELSLQHGWRILSAYRLNNGTRFWIITEADRTARRSCCRRSIEMNSGKETPSLLNCVSAHPKILRDWD